MTDQPRGPLVVTQLAKRYDAAGPDVVDGVSFTANPGDMLALVGPSGCGKTTTLRCIAGLERPDAGEIKLADQTLDAAGVHVPTERRHIGLVFQEYALFPNRSARKNITYGAHSGTRTQRNTQVDTLIDRLGLSEHQHRRPHQLSGGQRQRVALARSLAAQPALLLLDEPFSSLDAHLRQATRRDVRQLLKDTQTTTLLVTHDQEEALGFADHIAVMNAGRIEQTGTPEAVYAKPATAFVAGFLGRTNLLHGECRGPNAVIADTPIGPVQLDQPSSGSVLLSLRPEHLELQPAPQRNDAGHSDANVAITGVIVDRAFKGHDLTFRLQFPNLAAALLVHGDYRTAARPTEHRSVKQTCPAVVLPSTS